MPRGVYKRTEGCNKAHRGWHQTKKIKKALRERNKRLGIRPPSFKGKHHTEDAKRKIGEKSKGNKYTLGIHLGYGTRLKMSKARRGENNPNWKGGIGSLNKSLRASLKYRLWREEVFKRDNFTCQKCGARSEKGKVVYLEPHHIKSFSLILEENDINTLEKADKCKELWNIGNGITYCLECHIKVDKHRKRMVKK